MTTTKKISLLTLVVVVLALVLGFGQSVFGGYITSDSATVTPGSYQTYEFFASSTPATVPTVVATTTSATSTFINAYIDNQGRYNDGSFNIKGAKKVTVFFGRGGATSANTGSSTFSVQVSPDGTNWFDFSKLVQATSTVYQANTTISAATSTQAFGLDLSKDAFKSMRCVVVETTDGEHRCYASAEF